MKNLPRRVLAVLLLASLCIASAAEPAARAEATTQSRSAESEKFRISQGEIPPPGLHLAIGRLKAAEQRFRQGVASQGEIDELEFGIRQLASQTTSTLSVRSYGGTLGEFLSAASSVRGTLSVINAGAPSDLDAALPPFELRDASWSTVFEVIQTLLEPQGLHLRYTGGENPNLAGTTSLVYVLRRIAPSREATQSSDFESIHLGDYLAPNLNARQLEEGLASIVDAIRSAWKMEPGRNDAALRIQFHPPTQLLLVSGPAPAGKIARQVVAGLRKNPDSR